MNTRKQKPAKTATTAWQAAFPDAGSKPGNARDVRVLELVGDEEIDSGGDPYNFTGQKVIADILRRTDR